MMKYASFLPVAAASAALSGNAPHAVDSPRLPRVSVSSEETVLLRSDLAVDGDPNTRWSSSFADNQWLVIDLFEPREIRSVGILWNSAAAANGSVQVSTDGAAYETVAPIRDGSEGWQTIELDRPAVGRYLRLLLTERSTSWGFSIHDMRINGESVAAEDLPVPPEDAVYRDPLATPAARAADAVARMSFREKVRFLSGTEMFYFPENERLGLRRIFMADASMGLRLPESTAFPAFVGLAATFDPDLAARYGAAVAEECRAKGVHVLLGPGVNLYRVPQNGRNFEYLGEDPFLASRMIVPYIRSVQDRGVMATVKHFAANNHEWHRKASNSVVDERTLRELYFPAFEASVREANVGAVMTAYNLVNGEWAAQHPGLIQGVLRDEWGFNGLIMTDWWSVYDPMKVIRAGVNLEMPHADYLNEPAVRDLVEAGLVSVDEIDTMVAGTLRSFFRFGFYDREQLDPDAHAFGGPHDEIALETSRRGMVLLRNEGDFLPLDPAQTKRIVLIGANARETETSGFGAARVEPTNPVSILASFKRAMGDGVEVLHFDEVSPAARRAMETADASFVSVFTREREANDRPFALPAEQQELITAAAEVTDRLGVLVTAGSGIEMAPWIEDTRAVLMAWFGGNVGNTAVGEIIAGQTNPEGKLPFSIEKRWEDSAAYGRFLPHDATFNDVPIWNRERPVFPVVYDEGLLSGYRHFDAHGIEPQFAFGHGLSFTTFGFDGLEVELPGSAADPLAVVRVRVTNTGDREGAEVAQLYVGGIGDGADRPVRMLKGFEKVRLAPGESRVVEFGLSARDLSYFDPDQGKWRMDEGDVTVHVGASSRDLPLSARFGMPDDG